MDERGSIRGRDDGKEHKELAVVVAMMVVVTTMVDVEMGDGFRRQWV